MTDIVNRIFDNTVAGLTKALDLTWRRNQALTSNIANAETPQYRAADLNFAGELEKAFGVEQGDLTKTHDGHMDLSDHGSSSFAPDYSGATKPDGNNVDIDLQMGKLAYNSGAYTSAARLLRKQLGIIKMAIREGGR